MMAERGLELTYEWSSFSLASHCAREGPELVLPSPALEVGKTAPILGRMRSKLFNPIRTEVFHAVT